MIAHEKEYISYITQRGVGSNDKVADSVRSYVSYLNSVQKHLGVEIGPKSLSCASDIERLSRMLSGKVSDKTIGNYVSAMKQYVSMVNERSL